MIKIASFENYLEFYLKNNSGDCILFSEDGSKFKVHKELFGQTDFLRKILSSTKEHCCKIEVTYLSLFKRGTYLFGELFVWWWNPLWRRIWVFENLQNIFGFQRNLVLNYYSYEAFFPSDKNIETITVIEEVSENILDNIDPEDIVIIPPRSKNVSVDLVAIDQGKEL